jgi:cytochrome c556
MRQILGEQKMTDCQLNRKTLPHGRFELATQPFRISMKIKFILPLATICVGALLASSNVRAADLDEKSLQKLMKEVGDIAKRFKPSQDNKNGAVLAKDATRLAEINKQVTGFWKSRKFDDAVKLSTESADAATAAATAASAGDWDKVKTSVGAVMKNCKACHDAHREKLEDGGYRIK